MNWQNLNAKGGRAIGTLMVTILGLGVFANILEAMGAEGWGLLLLTLGLGGWIAYKLISRSWRALDRWECVPEPQRSTLMSWWLNIPLMLFGIFLIGYGIALFGYQIIHWLDKGSWVSCAVIDMLAPAMHDLGPNTWLPHNIGSNKFIVWVFYPESWVGLQSIVKWVFENVPVAFASLIGGGLLAGGALESFEACNKIEREYVTKNKIS